MCLVVMRNQNLISIRPQLNLSPSNLTAEKQPTIESFQNSTLRPILKMQHDLILLIWKNYLSKQKKEVFPTTNHLRQAEFISHNVKSDLKLKNRFIGTIIGHFTADEFTFFAENEAELMRRMTDLLVQRLQSTIES